MVKKILHLEGLGFFLAALYFYQQLGGNWIVFLLLLFVPDVTMVGYLKDKKFGAFLYNLGHNYILAFCTIILGQWLLQNTMIVFLGIILVAHVGLDRFLGFGLKYSTNFRDTHLQKI